MGLGCASIAAVLICCKAALTDRRMDVKGSMFRVDHRTRRSQSSAIKAGSLAWTFMKSNNQDAKTEETPFNHGALVVNQHKAINGRRRRNEHKSEGSPDSGLITACTRKAPERLLFFSQADHVQSRQIWSPHDQMLRLHTHLQRLVHLHSFVYVIHIAACVKHPATFWP